MVKIEAVVRPERLAAIHSALSDAGLHGMTVSSAHGHGRQKGYTQRYRGAEYATPLLPKVKLEVVVRDADCDRATHLIQCAAQTGEIGDGKLFVTPVLDAIRIRTEERGDAALS